jgi:hypothetical protein
MRLRMRLGLRMLSGRMILIGVVSKGREEFVLELFCKLLTSSIWFSGPNLMVTVLGDKKQQNILL